MHFRHCRFLADGSQEVVRVAQNVPVSGVWVQNLRPLLEEKAYLVNAILEFFNVAKIFAGGARSRCVGVAFPDESHV